MKNYIYPNPINPIYAQAEGNKYGFQTKNKYVETYFSSLIFTYAGLGDWLFPLSLLSTSSILFLEDDLNVEVLIACKSAFVVHKWQTGRAFKSQFIRNVITTDCIFNYVNKKTNAAAVEFQHHLLSVARNSKIHVNCEMEHFSCESWRRLRELKLIDIFKTDRFWYLQAVGLFMQQDFKLQ